ncbi:MAG: hypothetical protein IPL84_04125 [Chitinophagaceae bacterium]|nr:hypothetical protein [Chitinophagaceae bacterium]
MAVTYFLWRGKTMEPALVCPAGLFLLAAASHAILDAMTTGGLGVAFSPFDNTRYFFPLPAY